MKRSYNVPKQDLILKLTEELKKVKDISAPAWSEFVKTGANKARPPKNSDWWHTRSASVLVRISELGPIGVSKLRVKYGGKKRRGHQPPEFRMASGNILRKILQQFEKAGLAKQVIVSGHKGRIVTPKAISLINTAAKSTDKKVIVKKKQDKSSEVSEKVEATAE
jgi:small subunit ribosomal protein S19e